MAEFLSEARLPPGLRLLRRFPHLPRQLGLAERLYGRLLARHGVCWVETALGPVWKLDLANPTHRWLVYGHYEGPALPRWLDRNLPPHATVVVSGANIGQTLIGLVPRLPRGRLLAFEPDTLSADWIQSCLHRHPSWPVSLLRVGLSGAPGSASWMAHDTPHCHGSQNRILDHAASPGDATIPVTRLDTRIHSLGIHRVDLWILDVEGHEPAALDGASELLETRRLAALWVEVSAETRQPVCQRLAHHGYRPFSLTPAGQPVDPCADPHTNLLFLPR